ncbi:ribosomal L1 domain-containing protein 1 isoform X2 [Pyxicephalus adspersus]|uniref:ribosomal L1 domain-containing protein 1 isoform X2 n=1 Tax=Pyxicephalus adspersus TaxID=30357 RepID=UPI003B5BE1E9
MPADQITKAVQALLAYQRTKENAKKLILNEHDWMSLMVTVWRIPSSPKTLRIPLPHGIRPHTCEVCLFTRDEPNMTSEQTENFYKKMLAQHGITQITKVIPLKTMKKEYKPYEAKRRLLGSFDLFLADSRIRRLLPSHIGKHFYKEKREPQSVNLKAKNLSSELNRFIQGTQLHITNRGCCYSIRVGHTGMTVEHIVENTLAVSKVLAEKMPKKWKNIKILHLKTQASVALPIYNSPIVNLNKIDLTQTVDSNNCHLKMEGENLKEGKLVSTEEDLPVKNNRQMLFNKPQHKSVDEDEQNEDIPELVPILDSATTEKKLQTSKTPRKKAAGNTQQPGRINSAKRHKMTAKTDEEAKTQGKENNHTASEDLKSQVLSTKHAIVKKTSTKSTVKLARSAKKVPIAKKLKSKIN